MSLWTQSHRAPTRPGRRPAFFAALLVILVASIGTTLMVVFGGGDPEPTALGGHEQGSGTGGVAGGRSSSPPVERTLPVVPPADGVALPSGTAAIKGYEVGFPRTDLGAVSAAVEIIRAQVGFDYDQAATAARVYAAPDDVEVLTTRARAAVGYRRDQLGVAHNGAVVAPAAFALIPFAFQAKEMDPGCYAVTVLSLASTTTTRGELRNVYYAGTQLIGWVDDDWKAVAPSAEQRRRLLRRPPLTAVGPNDPRFRRAGWITITTPEASP